MSIGKQFKDYLTKIFWGKSSVPRGLYEAERYFRAYEPIKFERLPEDGLLIARSINFRYGTIIAQGKNEQELEENIIDAILTSFEIPSSYKNEAQIKNVKNLAYATT
jgi:hypothetical protein